MQFLLRLLYPFPVLAVNDENKSLRASVIVSPERSDLVLAANIPNVEFHILVSDSLDVESN